MNAVLIFLCAFIVVYAMTVQSFNLFGRRRNLATVTSFIIGLCQLGLLKLVPMPTSGLDIAAYVLGGPLGVNIACRTHPWIVAMIDKHLPSRTQEIA